MQRNPKMDFYLQQAALNAYTKEKFFFSFFTHFFHDRSVRIRQNRKSSWCISSVWKKPKLILSAIEHEKWANYTRGIQHISSKSRTVGSPGKKKEKVVNKDPLPEHDSSKRNWSHWSVKDSRSKQGLLR